MRSDRRSPLQALGENWGLRYFYEYMVSYITEHPLLLYLILCTSPRICSHKKIIYFFQHHIDSPRTRNAKSRTTPSISSLPSMPVLLELSNCQVFAKNTIYLPRVFKALQENRDPVDISNDMSEMRKNQSGSK
jgi:hypothetical protein